MAAKPNTNPLDMVFWFNITPKDGTNERTFLHDYDWRLPLEELDPAAEDVVMFP